LSNGYTKDIAREIFVFVNAAGGKIVVGVSDNGSVKGVDVSNKKLSAIQNLTRNIEPSIDIQVYNIENLIIIEVPEGTQKPYSVNGRFFLRTGPSSQQLNTEEVRDFFQKERRVFFDELENMEFSVESDIDVKAFGNFVKALGVSNVLGKSELLDNLDLLKNERMKNAGVLLFSKRVSRFIRTATITCVLYQGHDKYKVLDRKEYEGNLYSNFTDAINYLRSKLNTEFIIKGGPREERLELPEEALREALLNAIAHRDYYSTGNIQVSVFKDRVEIDNPGGLFGRMKVDDLFGRSLPRNPLLFDLMQRMSLVEKIGSGLMRMKSVVREYNLPDIELLADKNWFTIVFSRVKEEKLAEKKGKPKEKTREKTREKVFQLIEKKPEITTIELMEATGLTRRGIEWNLAKLKEEGVIRRKGSKKSGYWEIL